MSFVLQRVSALANRAASSLLVNFDSAANRQAATSPEAACFAA